MPAHYQRDLIPDVVLERQQFSDRMEYYVVNKNPTSALVDIDISGSSNVA